MSTIKDINLKDQRVLVRVDFNVPLNAERQVTDDTRIQKAIPTLNYILDQGAKLILCSHLGRPKPGEDNSKFSLQHIVTTLEHALGRKVHFAHDCIGREVEQKATDLQNGEVLLLENLRFHTQETKGDEDFARQLSKLADVYINDAFGTAHRAHASTTTVAKFYDKTHKAFGLLMEAELVSGNKVLNNPEKPVTAIIGGAKVSDKIVLLERLVESTDNILIGGGMAYTFLKAIGGNIGTSLCEDDFIETALNILEKAEELGCNIYLPVDSVIADRFAADADHKLADSKKIDDGWMGLDIGPKAIESYSKVVLKSKTLLWNGPMGVFEMENFSKGTIGVAKAVAEATKKGAFSLIGGGDSVSAINQAGLQDEVSYVSTGGGAMLEFLEGKTLPGVGAILSEEVVS
jgi:phosphoglycerate kinase